MFRAFTKSSPLRRRAPALMLALAIEALLLLALLAPMAMTPPKRREPALVTIKVAPLPPPPSQAKAAVRVKETGGSAPAKRTEPQPPKPPVPPAFVEVTRNDFAAGDISKLASHRAEGSDGSGHAAAYGPGEGPGGAALYNAEWYREPTPGELALYLPKGGPRPGSAMIICKTLPAYRVDDCRSLGETPPGSGLASALRQAAWQFKVVPPRLDGKPLIGAWVRIRFDWYEHKTATDER